jgi:hypothetical protein
MQFRRQCRRSEGRVGRRDPTMETQQLSARRMIAETGHRVNGLQSFLVAININTFQL